MDVFDLFAKISLDTSEYEKGLDEASGKSSSFIDKLGNGIATAAKVGAAAIGATATAIGGLVTASTNAYAEYEQLVGGVETLFKDSAGIVQEYAENAYRTAGLSANEYMETVTGFSASLLQSLGGDTKAAAEYADTAIRDMSDNANKMGTSMESIQNAYQGFAKQNYTMLDNLKLGYGGTTSEMYRLLQDAANLNEEFERTSTFSMDAATGHLTAGYDEIIEAIHIVQTEMGISGLTAEQAAEMVEQGVLTQEEAYERMGTTAKEAATTIEGSFNSLKSAWENLVVGFARDDADIGQLIENVVSNAETTFTNILPVAERALSGVGEFVSRIAPVIAEKLPELAVEILPSLIETGVSFIVSIAQGITDNLPMLIESALSILEMLSTALIDNLPMIIESALQIILGLALGIAEALPELIPAIVDTMLTIVDTLIDNIDLLLDAAIAIILGLADGLINALPKLLDKAPEIVEKLVKALITNAPKLLEAALVLILALVNGLLDNIPELLNAIAQITEKAVESFKENAPLLIEGAKSLMNKLEEGLIEASDHLLDIAVDIISTLVQGIVEAGKMLIDAAKNVMDIFKNGIKKSGTDKAKDWGIDLVNNFINGIKSSLNPLEGAGELMANTIGQYIHFSEPDKGPLSNFHTYAPDMMKLFAEGIEDNTHLLTDQISKSFDFGGLIGGLNAETSMLMAAANARPSLTTGTAAGSAKPTENRFYLDGREIARAILPYLEEERQRLGTSLTKGALT